MTSPLNVYHVQNQLTAYFWSGDVIRSRSVSDMVLSCVVEIPAPPVRLMADWERDISLRLELEPGDVESLPLARARMHWPGYKYCVQAASDWTRKLGLQDVLSTSDVALMACRGAKYHHDGAQYGGSAFCNLFLSEDRGFDLHFPYTGHRIPLVRGTAVMFDTGQPHAVIDRRSTGFNANDFPPEQAGTQIFLTWELPIENADVGRELGIALDTEASIALQLDEEQVWLNGKKISVHPETGPWCVANLTELNPSNASGI
jgi:hypothetical protein